MTNVQLPPNWYDLALLAYLTVFFLYEGFLLRRETRLGWSLAAKCVALGLLFAYGLASRFVPVVTDVLWVGSVLRALLAVALTWAIIELRRMHVRTRPD